MDEPPSPEELIAHVEDADAILCLLTERIDDPVLDAAGSRLRIVANMAVGYDNIDVAACRLRGRHGHEHARRADRGDS